MHSLLLSLTLVSIAASSNVHANSFLSFNDQGQIVTHLEASGDLTVNDYPSFELDAQQQNLTNGFNIIIDYGTSNPTPEELAAFSAAEAAWESRIIGYKDTIRGKDANAVTISVTLEPNDGPGGVLGSAGPTTAKTGQEENFLYAASGSMTFDTADTANLVAAGTFDKVIEHEMGHVLGLGTLWSSSGAGIAGYQELYVNGSGEYTGASALAQWQTEFGQGGASFIPVELGGGSGTANGHWNEVDGGAGPTGITQAGTGRDMRDELMTGWLNPDSFISNMTIAQFEDLGYTVVLNPVPEPASALFSLLGFGALASLRRRR
ncbi:PEP-CTERM sorting domain-containing protein [Verrucomicrobiaceae bacterium N1E253]|uniref:PEP-CTERM sorting domain-containing protein n=1 Tax=Oceaniferula marina TaxID=2748318 RepID=A0A851GI84_9BACT|nr:VPLPA-CTERM sorting domain-containing protein [Oceaniferula marina]NWK56632.1 PEP-CTERM sorting domain-containing protein [Oceaniferula marina]